MILRISLVIPAKIKNIKEVEFYTDDEYNRNE